jgi:hypothetical protein
MKPREPAHELTLHRPGWDKECSREAGSKGAQLNTTRGANEIRDGSQNAWVSIDKGGQTTVFPGKPKEYTR